MDRVHDANELPFDEIRNAAIAIREVSADQRHLGVIYRDPDSLSLSLLHLAWHFDLRNDEPHVGYLWIHPDIDERRLVQLSAVCRHVWRANGKGTIPYGFSSPVSAFDTETFRYLSGTNQVGLTCATFVLALFHRAGLALVEYSTWPEKRPGDDEWRERIIKHLLERGEATPAHIEKMRNDLAITVRYRPEEVAGAATKPIPVVFAIADEIGKQVLNRFRDM